MTTEKIDLSKYPFPKVGGIDMAFPTFYAPKDLVAYANTLDLRKAEREFRRLFYEGGKVNLKPDVKGTWKEHAWRFCRALMGSFAPSHEDKTAVCALIINECLELD